MNGPYTVSAVSQGITAAVTVGSGAAAVTTCGKGKAKLRRIVRKGTSEADRNEFKLVDGPIVDVVNPDPIAFASGVKIKLGFDETGLRVVLNNVCE